MNSTFLAAIGFGAIICIFVVGIISYCCMFCMISDMHEKIENLVSKKLDDSGQGEAK